MSSSAEQEFPQWRPPGPDDVRSPCPALNSMANHGIIPHNGRGLNSAMLSATLQKTYNTDPLLSRLAIISGTMAPRLFFGGTFNLDDLERQKVIKHDGLFGRPDFNTGADVNAFSEETWDSVKVHFHGLPQTSFGTVADARRGRAAEAIRRNPSTVNYNSIRYLVSFGELAALLAVFADPGTGSTCVQYLDIWFAEERLPYDEGWRPHDTPVTLGQVLKNVVRLIRETGEDDTRPPLIRWLGIGGGKAKTR